MSSAIKSKSDMLVADVASHYAYYKEILIQLQRVLTHLSRKPVPPALHINVPESDQTPTFTLYDWIPSESINQLRQEGLQEMAELQVNNNFLSSNSNALRK